MSDAFDNLSRLIADGSRLRVIGTRPGPQSSALPATSLSAYSKWKIECTTALSPSSLDVFLREFRDSVQHPTRESVRCGIGILQAAAEYVKHLPAENESASMVGGGGPATSQSADLVIVCALNSPELDKLLAAIPALRPAPARSDDAHIYHVGEMPVDAHKTLSVVAAAPTQMGLPAAAILATKMIIRWQPRLVAMTGIAAGVREDEQGFGDIVAASQTFDWGSGKISPRGRGVEFSPDPQPIAVNHRLLARLKEWERTQHDVDKIERGWPASKPRTRLTFRVGPLASGASVLNARKPVDDIVQHWRKLTAVEMEAYGVHCACRQARDPEPMFLCVKSVCDFAHDKEDNWQEYAAYTSAAFLVSFLKAEWAALFA